MRNLVLAIVGLSVVAIALPNAPANAEDAIVIRNDRDRDHDRDWHRHHKKVVVIKHHRHGDRDHDRVERE
jgi:Ni/Co efflux regulator RcnB